MRDAKDCNKYITCYSTGIRDDIRAEIRSCGIGKYWDQSLLTCRSSIDVSCSVGKFVTLSSSVMSMYSHS